MKGAAETVPLLLAGGEGIAAEEAEGAGGAKCSFSPSTPVLMDKGKTKPIGKIKAGDKVEAADPKTGKHQGSRTVQHVWINRDHDLLDVTIRTENGHTATLHTTANHPFWNDTAHAWTPAGKLHHGDASTQPPTTTRTLSPLTAHPAPPTAGTSQFSNSTRTMYSPVRRQSWCTILMGQLVGWFRTAVLS